MMAANNSCASRKEKPEMTEETRNPNFHKDNIECTVEPDGEGKVKQTFKFKKNETWIKH